LDSPFLYASAQIPIHLAKYHKVLFIDPIEESILTVLKHPGRVADILRRVWHSSNPVQKGEKLFALSPAAIFPVGYSNRYLKFINKQLVLWQIRSAIRKLRLKSIIFLTYQRLDWDYVGKLGEILSTYHCTDLFGSFEFSSEEERRDDVQKEEGLIRKSDIVFATEKELTELIKGINENTFYLPNATDYELYSKAALPDTKIADDLSDIPHPIVGFVGIIAEINVDFSVLEYAARNRPQWSFVMIGPMREPEFIPRLKNIYYIGPRRKEEIPHYLKAFDACIIPNPDNEHCKYAFDVKFFEYLAAGKPVVTGCKPALKDYPDLFYESKDQVEFVDNLDKALVQDNPRLVKKRQEAARENTWDKRVQQMLSIIDGKVSNRGCSNWTARDSKAVMAWNGKGDEGIA
jgi:glycosyltransferase involved in cell wall biosynthesis